MKSSGVLLGLAFSVSAFACSVPAGDPNAGTCTLTDNGDGSSTLACPDGTKTFLRNGTNGKDAEPGAERTSPASFGPTLEGSVAIENAIDLALLAGVKHVTGDVTIGGAALTGAALPDLERVDGTVHLVGADLETIAFPRLTHVGGLHVEGTRLLTIETFSSVAGAVGALRFSRNPRLGRLAGLEGITAASEITIDHEPLLVGLNGLSGIRGHVANGVVVTNNAELTSIAGLSGLGSAGGHGVVVSANPKLATIALPSLAAASAIGIQLGGVRSIELPSLAVVRDVSIANNPVLASVAMNELARVDGAFHVDLNSSLERLDVEKLEKAGTFHLYLDPKLTTASFRSIVAVDDQYLVVGTGLRQCQIDEWTTELAAPEIVIADNASGGCD